MTRLDGRRRGGRVYKLVASTLAELIVKRGDHCSCRILLPLIRQVFEMFQVLEGLQVFGNAEDYQDCLQNDSGGDHRE